ncbi:MAG: DUF3343 domain-containing protein [Acutalibacteraceae bacterium]
MKNYVITTGTVTYAIKGRDLLRKNGYNVKIERISSGRSAGCGYSIVLTGALDKAEELLRSAGIKILEIYEK